ncbi:MAG: helix-turn-helix domain-containing protein [Cyanobacteria bacterium REEB65]|nr:helix-turn-helix domain-containing protein [Cyanobacteria bacterium REEB65]
MAPRTRAAVANLFKVLADGTRLQILAALEQGEISVTDLAALLEMSVSAISHQLRVLRQAGVVRTRRVGKSIHYAIDDDHVTGLLDQALRHAEHR